MADIVALNLAKFENILLDGGIIIDCRPLPEFTNGYAKGAIYSALLKINAKLLAACMDGLKDILIIATPGKEQIFANGLAAIGFINITGYLDGGFETWKQAEKPLDIMISIEPDEFLLDIKYSKPHIIDIRHAAQYNNGHIEGAENIPPIEIALGWEALANAKKTFYIYDEDGSNSATLISFLKSKGLHNYYHLTGGFAALKAAGAPVEVEIPKI